MPSASSNEISLPYRQPVESQRDPSPATSGEQIPKSTTSDVPRHVRTRRKRYLELHPTYFATASGDLEISDPLSYDRLIRQHQSASEREAEGRSKGWAATLETTFLRSEAKLAEADPTNPKYASATVHTSPHNQRTSGIQSVDWGIEDFDSENDDTALETDNENTYEHLSEARTPAGDDSAENIREASKSKARKQAQNRWRTLVADRFVEGRDQNFDYSTVDEDAALDEDWSGKQVQEDWFEDEEEMLEGTEGETGVQDF